MTYLRLEISKGKIVNPSKNKKSKKKKNLAWKWSKAATQRKKGTFFPFLFFFLVEKEKDGEEERSGVVLVPCEHRCRWELRQSLLGYKKTVLWRIQIERIVGVLVLPFSTTTSVAKQLHNSVTTGILVAVLSILLQAKQRCHEYWGKLQVQPPILACHMARWKKRERSSNPSSSSFFFAFGTIENNYFN